MRLIWAKKNICHFLGTQRGTLRCRETNYRLLTVYQYSINLFSILQGSYGHGKPVMSVQHGLYQIVFTYSVYNDMKRRKEARTREHFFFKLIERNKTAADYVISKLVFVYQETEYFWRFNYWHLTFCQSRNCFQLLINIFVSTNA